VWGLSGSFLEAIKPITDAAPVKYVVNTHSDGDHIYGNQLFGDEVEIVATAAAARAMYQSSVDPLVATTESGAVPGSYFEPIKKTYGTDFDFRGITVRKPDITFCGRKALTVGALSIDLVELGPAHTVGDLIVSVPDRDLVFTGDLLTEGIGVPVCWAGPVTNWIDAVDVIRNLDAETVVCGHGGILTGDDRKTTYDSVSEYWQRTCDAAKQAFDDGRSVLEGIAYSPHNDLLPPDLLLQNTSIVFHHLDNRFPKPTQEEGILAGAVLAAEAAKIEKFGEEDAK
jgi:cyclase